MIERADLGKLFELSPDLLYVASAEGCLLQVNGAFCKTLGYGREIVLGRRFFDFIHPDDRLASQAQVGQLLSDHLSSQQLNGQPPNGQQVNGQPINGSALQSFQQRWCHADGSFPWLAGKVTAADQDGDYLLYGWAREAVQPEARLGDREQHFRTIFDQAPIGIACLSLSGQWLEVNDRLCEMLGYGRELLRSKTFAEITHPEDTQQDAHYHEQLISGAVASCRFDKRYLRSDGESLWTAVAVAALHDTAGQVSSFLAMIQDIGDRKAHELERAERASELRQLNMALARATGDLRRRNAELDQFAYVVSHDLKAPLRALSSLAAWLAEDNADKLGEESQRHLALMQQRVVRMGGLLDGLLDYSRIGRVNAEPKTIVVRELLAEVLDSLEIPEGFRIAIVDPMPTLVAREISLSQVFSNLISNAVRHCDRPDGQLRISARETATAYEFTLADNGPGIDPAYHGRIFEIFQTLQPRDRSDSTGVGLSIVKKIMAVEQGEIWLAPHSGAGATFHFSWPKAATSPN